MIHLSTKTKHKEEKEEGNGVRAERRKEEEKKERKKERKRERRRRRNLKRKPSVSVNSICGLLVYRVFE